MKAPRSFTLVPALVFGLVACGLSQADQAALAAACEGQAVSGAAGHDGGPTGFAPFKRDAAGEAFAYDINGVHFELQRPATLAEARTVFCMEPAEEVAEGLCAFDEVEGIGVAGVQVVETGRSEGPTFPRVSMQRTARLVDPSTGATIAEHTVKIDAPKCDGFVGDPTAEAFHAMTPSGISFADWATAQLGVTK